MSKLQRTPSAMRRMGPRHGMAAPGEKAKDFKGSIKKLCSYLGKYKFRIFFVMLFAIASTIFMILGPKEIGRASCRERV